MNEMNAAERLTGNLTCGCQCGLSGCASQRTTLARGTHGYNRYNKGCRCEACAAAAAAHQSRRIAKAQAESLPQATRRGMQWIGAELEIVMRADLTARDAARMLGRTVEAVLWARKKCRKDPRFSALAGVNR